MQDRNILETALQQAIEKQNTEQALTLITLIRKDPAARLNSYDDNGKSFLSTALENSLKKVADRLLELQGDNNDLLFRKNGENKDCLYYAIQKNFVDIANNLLEISSRQLDPNQPGYKIWLQSYAEGQTHLHAAVKYKNIIIAKNLLKKINQEPEAINHINRPDHCCNTPLQLATPVEPADCNEALVALLIEQGADLTISNNKEQTPFGKILTFPFEKQVALLSQFADTAFKEKFLALYREQVIIDKNNPVRLDHYYRLAASYKLVALAGAKVEFDQRIEVQRLPQGILELVPLYKSRLSNHLSKKRKSVLVIDSDEESSEESSNKPTLTYKQLILDLKSLDKALNEIKNFIAELNAQDSELIISPCMAGGLAFCASLPLFIAIEIWLGVRANNSSPVLETSISNDAPSIYNAAAIGFGVGFPIGLGLLFTICAAFMQEYDYYFRFPNKIKSDDWKNGIEEAELILEKIQGLEEKILKPLGAYEDYQITEQILRDLENTLAQLQVEQRSIQDLIGIFNRLESILTTIQFGIHSSGKPFSILHETQSLSEVFAKKDCSSSFTFHSDREESSQEDADTIIELNLLPYSSISSDDPSMNP